MFVSMRRDSKKFFRLAQSGIGDGEAFGEELDVDRVEIELEVARDLDRPLRLLGDIALEVRLQEAPLGDEQIAQASTRRPMIARVSTARLQEIGAEFPPIMR
jgi:hypothetical protein